MNEIGLRALRATIRVAGPEEALELLRRSLPELLIDVGAEMSDPDGPTIVWERSDSGGWSIEFGEGGSIAGAHTSLALAETITEVNRLAAGSVAHDHAINHAGTFRVGGRTVAVAGESGAGKSTLVAAAALRGLSYVGDEVCAIDPSSRDVVPFRRPIGLRAGGAAALGLTIPEHPLDPYREVYPWQPPSPVLDDGPAPLGLIALVERRAGPVELVPVRAAEALVRLTELTLAANRIERQAFRRLDDIVRQVPMVRIFHDDPFGAVDVLATYCDSSEVG